MKYGILRKYGNKIEGTMFSSAQLKQLIFPLIIEQVLSITVGMVDTMMISYAGEAAMSGVSLVDMINNLLNSVFAAVATGGAVVISQYLGKRERDKAAEAATQLVTTAVLIAIGFAVISIIGNLHILRILFGSIEDDVMQNARLYFFISAWSYPFLALFNAGAAIFRSIGNAKVSMNISVGMNLFNALGNAVLIFGFSMGAAGAAISTLVARIIGALVIFSLACKKKNEVRVSFRALLRLKRDMVGKILYIAVPSGIENGLFQAGRVLVVSIIALFGTTQIAANAVANTLDAMGCIAGQAMNLAMITVVGRCIGAGDKAQAVHYSKKLMKITYVITFVINSLILLGLPWILKLYALSPEAYRYAFILVLIHDGLAILMWPASFTLSNALRAAGDVKFCMITSVFSMVFFRIVFSVILGMWLGWGAIGVWIAMIIDWIFRSSLFIWRFVQGKWLEYKIV